MPNIPSLTIHTTPRDISNTWADPRDTHQHVTAFSIRAEDDAMDHAGFLDRLEPHLGVVLDAGCVPGRVALAIDLEIVSGPPQALEAVMLVGMTGDEDPRPLRQLAGLLAGILHDSELFTVRRVDARRLRSLLAVEFTTQIVQRTCLDDEDSPIVRHWDAPDRVPMWTEAAIYVCSMQTDVRIRTVLTPAPIDPARGQTTLEDDPDEDPGPSDIPWVIPEADPVSRTIGNLWIARIGVSTGVDEPVTRLVGGRISQRAGFTTWPVRRGAMSMLTSLTPGGTGPCLRDELVDRAVAICLMVPPLVAIGAAVDDKRRAGSSSTAASAANPADAAPMPAADVSV